MDLERLKFEALRFFGSGMKRHWFTEFLYEAFYIHTNLFIAHFDKSGFYNTRFSDPDGLRKTLEALQVTPRNEAHKIIRGAALECSSMLQSNLVSKDLRDLKSDLEFLIGKSVFIPLKYSEERASIRNSLTIVKDQVTELLSKEGAS